MMKIKNKFKGYTFIKAQNMVIAITTFAGRTVRAKAKCHPNDEFDYEFGKELAAARCNVKVARRRYQRAMERYNKSLEMRRAAMKEFNECSDYLTNSYSALKVATMKLSEVEDKI